MAAKKKVVFVESPAKAKTIQKFVDRSTIVRATFGHIRDLPKSNLGVEVEKNFEPKYVIPRKSAAVVKELKALIKGADSIYLATDPDREGEAIAWHVMQALGLTDENVHRILFHEITKTAIQHALDNPGKLNHDLVDAQQARRVLDRLVGYQLSPLLWKKIYRGLSAGRVQSAALRLITDREAEIVNFKPTEYWSLWATFTTEKKEQFLAKLEKIDGKSIGKYPSQETIEKAQAFGKDHVWELADRIVEQKQRHPKPPFTTSTLQQEAGRKLRFSVKQTMMHAQKLYEGISLAGETVGLITYMRTDSVNLADTAIAEARDVIVKHYGEKYIPKEPRKYKTKSKGAQEAHEAIRPSSFERTPDSVKQYLAPAEFKLYKLIWERAMACQMSSADTEVTQLHVGPKDKPTAVTYVASGVRIVFPGFLKAYEEIKEEEAVEDVAPEEQILPLVNKGDALDLENQESKQHFTQPPARYTEASLVKEMERLGIGRPSTYSPTISTIVDRGYVVKEEGKFMPQEIGTIVINLLKERFPSIVDFDFTAKMEDELDEVADGNKEWPTVIKDFYGPFAEQLAEASKDLNIKIIEEEATGEVCPQCGKPVVIKYGRFGKFYACTGFPECRHTRPIDVDEKQESLIEGRTCPNDNAALVVKTGRFGSFIGCSNYPECKFIEPILKETGVKCPKDGGSVIERKSKRGKTFFGCSNYPKCDFVAWDKPLPEPCPQCKGILVTKKKQIVCLACEYKRDNNAEESESE